MIEDIEFTVNDKNGIKKYIIIDKFNKNNKEYIIYKEKDNDDLYAALCMQNQNELKIIPIEDSNDYDIVDQYLENL